MGENLSQEQITQAFFKEFEEYQNYLLKVSESYKDHDISAEVGCLPKKTIFEDDLMFVYRYDMPKSSSSNQKPEPLLIINPLINGYYVLDLLPELSFTKFLTENNIVPYIIQWKNIEVYDKKMTFDYYVEQGVKKAIDLVHKEEKEDLILIGHCLGGLLGLAYLSVFNSQKIKKYISLNSPTDFSQMGLLNRLTSKSFMDIDLLVDSFGNIPADYMTLSFQFINPGLRFKAKMALFRFYFNPLFVRVYKALMQWSDDNINMPGEFARSLIKDFFQENKMFLNNLKVGEKEADIATIKIPVLNISSLLDDIAPYAACDALLKKIPHADKIDLPNGHLAIVTLPLMGLALKPYWDSILNWIKKES